MDFAFRLGFTFRQDLGFSASTFGSLAIQSKVFLRLGWIFGLIFLLYKCNKEVKLNL